LADCGGIGQREGAMLGMSAGLSQISNAPGLSCVVNLFFTWWNDKNRMDIIPILFSQ
jgi:hypothetical protein